MRAERRRIGGVALLLVPAALLGCHSRTPASSAVTTDTLAGGTVRVRNAKKGLWAAESGGSGAVAPGWSLVQDLRLGSVAADSPELFGRIAALAVDTTGRIYVLDYQAGLVRVFGSKGRYVRTLGRRGQGPGEFSNPEGLAVDGQQRLWVIDLGNGRYSVFDTTGALVLEERRFTAGQVGWQGAILNDGRVVDADLTPDMRTVFTIHGSTGQVQDTVTLPAYAAHDFEYANGRFRVTASVPFSPQLIHVFDPRGYLWTAVTDDYRIVKRDLAGGDSLLVVKRTYDPVPVTAAEADTALAGLDWFRKQGGTVDRSRIPDHHPPLTGFFLDDVGYLWVEPVMPRSGPVTRASLYRAPSVFDVFDPRGRYLGRLDAGEPLLYPLVVGRRLYGVTTDSLGVEYVVRMEIRGR